MAPERAEPDPDPPAPITRLRVLERTGSTNTDLARLAIADPPAWPHLSVLTAREQTAGKGRAGRTWDSSGLRALTFSVLVRPRADRAQWGWIPLLAGLATVRALRSRAGKQPGATERVAVKWPNDVVDVLGGRNAEPGWGRMRKLGGVLTEVLADDGGAVVGIGLNLAGTHLPVPWAGTLAGAGLMPAELGQRPDESGDGPGGPGRASREHGDGRDAGADETADDVVHAIVGEFAALLTALEQGQDVRALVEQVCVSIGADVRVELPDGSQLEGTAARLASDGALIVHTAHGEHTIRAGDVRHLRAPAQ
ncbi:biotin--[acetyl-CoA-carboxylase] ligase [Pseudactinotalea sp. Z1739]|uniref:biotin--[acetyl-CoA-carboxylase] ligase n=1 Tax=Pseudactinotalea sp. Z1739 TaxID=3413028 RepID=UPI003C7E4B73